MVLQPLRHASAAPTSRHRRNERFISELRFLHIFWHSFRPPGSLHIFSCVAERSFENWFRPAFLRFMSACLRAGVPKAASTLLVVELEIQGYYKYKAARALVGRAVGRQSSKCVCRLNIALPKESRKSQPQQGQEGRSEKKAEPLVTTQSR